MYNISNKPSGVKAKFNMRQSNEYNLYVKTASAINETLDHH